MTSRRRRVAPSPVYSCWKTGASIRYWRGPSKRQPKLPRTWVSVLRRFLKAPPASAPATKGPSMPETESHTLAQTSERELIQVEDRWGAHNYRPLDVVVERAEGVWVYAVDGHRYMDCLSAYSALNQGHCHPRIVQALVDQASRV